LDANLTQEALAARSGVSADAISMLERGIRRSPRRSTIDLLSRALRLGPEDARLLRQAGDAPVEPALETATVTGASIAPPVGRLPAEVHGREPLLRELAEQRGLVVLAGCGGIGKSTVAAELARRMPPGRPVWWVSAADASGLATGTVTVARSLGASETDLRALAVQAGDAPDRLWSLLERVPAPGWLLVLDNADQPELLAARGGLVADGTGLPRDSSRGLVLVTSRHVEPETWGRQARIERLGPLSDLEAARVLLDLAPGAGDDQQARSLGNRLGGLPLALHLAGAYLSWGIGRWTSFRRYERALDIDQAGAGLLGPDPDAPVGRDPRAAVMRTWELSLDDLARRGLPHARPVLRLLSCFAPGIPIPLELLQPADMDGLLTSAPEEMGPGRGRSDTRVERALRGLARLDLVQAAVGEGGIVVHPVIADANRAHLLTDTDVDLRPEMVWRTAVRLVARIIDALDWAHPDDRASFHSLVPHLRVLHDAPDGMLDAEHLTTLIEASRRTILAHVWGPAGPEAPDLLFSMPLQASEFGEPLGVIPTGCNHHHHRYFTGSSASWDDAEAALRETVASRRRDLGDDHAASLVAHHNLARLHAFQDRFEEAARGFERVLAAQRRVLGEGNQDVLINKTNIALMLAWGGRWPEAEACLVDVLGWFCRRFGDEHPASLYARQELAWAIANQGRWTEAEACLGEVVVARRGLFGDTHSATLAARHQLAWTVGGQGRWAEAEAAFRGIVLAKRQTFGDAHPDTLAARHNLAWAIAEQGRWPEAETMLRDVLDAKRRIFGEDHAFTQSTRRALASLRLR
jgi:transcriptional regulator with XRE-family HTH domain/tetratricopeptide (TPR) repeat protein